VITDLEQIWSRLHKLGDNRFGADLEPVVAGDLWIPLCKTFWDTRFEVPHSLKETVIVRVINKAESFSTAPSTRTTFLCLLLQHDANTMLKVQPWRS